MTGKLSGFATDTRQTSISHTKLSELDRLREDILKSGSTQFEINSKTNSYFQNTLGETKGKANLKNAGCGLLLKTYQCDIQYTDASGVVSSTETFEIEVIQDVTR